MDQNRVENQVDEGTLQIHLTNASTGIPVKGAKISISYTGGPQQVLEEVDTDDSGNTEKITLDAPPLEYSMEPGENQPYAEYTIKVHATGYRDITVSAINILSGEDATQEVVMEAQDAPGNPIDTIVIDAHTLYGEYPPKIPESEIKTVEETGEIVLSRVVIPEYVVVHDGARSPLPTSINVPVRILTMFCKNPLPQYRISISPSLSTRSMEKMVRTVDFFIWRFPQKEAKSCVPTSACAAFFILSTSSVCPY